MRINPDTGLKVADAQAGIVDYFYQEFLPPEHETLVGGGDRAATVRGKRCATSCSEFAMPRETGRNDRRSHIAHLAARLMAEDGIEDYALAKRKAARQAGAPDTRELPTNEEIDAALRTYQQIYHQEEHRARLRALRETALRAMQELAQFNPYLTGSVLNGNAGKYADINLQLFTDSAKAVELYLIDRGNPIPDGAEPAVLRRLSRSPRRCIPSTMTGPRSTSRCSRRANCGARCAASLEGKTIERAKLPAVAAAAGANLISRRLQPAGGIECKIGEYAVGAGALEGSQHLHHARSFIQPAARARRLQHRVFAADVIDEGRHLEFVLHAAHDVQVGQARA